MRSWIVLGILASSLAWGEDRSFNIIVHPSNPLTEVERRFMSDVFLKKVTTWPHNGAVVRPVDLTASSSARGRFSLSVIGRTVDSVKIYWQQAIFSGRNVPPPELSSDAEVIAYVAKNPQAVGYVATGAELTGVKIMQVK
jgi:ABC-type phosphate transport system substrate-binding protein